MASACIDDSPHMDAIVSTLGSGSAAQAGAENSDGVVADEFGITIAGFQMRDLCRSVPGKWTTTK